MTILVTGSAGFIGFHLCKRLLNEGEKVIGLDKYSFILHHGTLGVAKLDPWNSTWNWFGQSAHSYTSVDFVPMRPIRMPWAVMDLAQTHG